MKKVFVSFIVTTLCAAALLPARVSGKKSAPQDAAGQQQGAPAQVQSGVEVQFGERAVTGRVRDMPRGKDRGKHMVPDKEYEPRFDPNGLTRLGYITDPVVQTTPSDSSMEPLMAHPTDAAPAAPSPNAVTQLLGNPGFETGTASPWVTTAGVIDSSASEPAHTGAWKAWLDGYGTTHTDTLYQQVTVPAGATATLTFWLHIDSAETTTTTAFDKLTVQVRNSSNAVLSTLATYSNLNKAAGYSQKTFNLSSFQGQTIRIFLTGTEDSTLQTSFVVDDFTLDADTGSPTPTPTPAPSALLNFDGLGVGGGYTPNAAPPDTNGAIGATQYVQWVNEAFAVYSKTTGAKLSGPTNGNQLFQALGATHQCAVTNDGDPVVQYDKANNRWVMTQFAVTNGTTKGFYECIAVSQTSDA
ncbi:MAG TPA: hypothetical protein VF521_05510, partial [Pyrinomonadaceae bacterium]